MGQTTCGRSSVTPPSRDESGNLLIIHCASGYNNVVITGIEGFTSIGRPVYFSD